jgi:hypothetical protein
MKYSNYIGTVTAVLLIVACFADWVYVESIHKTISGMNTSTTGLGKPGLVHIVFAAAAIAFFLLPYTWAKRINLFVTALNVAWAIRNFLVVTQCQMGECPQKKFGIYTVIVSSFLLLIMSMLPKLSIVNEHPPVTESPETES